MKEWDFWLSGSQNLEIIYLKPISLLTLIMEQGIIERLVRYCNTKIFRLSYQFIELKTVQDIFENSIY
jgi:hypothetical protein